MISEFIHALSIGIIWYAKRILFISYAFETSWRGCFVNYNRKLGEFLFVLLNDL